jgi:hypothetical protein
VGPSGESEGRFSGGGEYAGVLVLMVAAFAVARAASGGGRQPFNPLERKLVAFWGVACVLSLLFSLGRFAPFYRLVYSLPYFSTIRIPMKFMHPFHLCLLVLFAYGLLALVRGYGEAAVAQAKSFGAWWRTAPGFDRAWLAGSGMVVVLAGIGAAVYGGKSRMLDRKLSGLSGYLGEPATAAFSLRETWIAVVLITVCVALLLAFQRGWFSGGRVKVGVTLLGVVLAGDLWRANQPWIHTYNYERRYQPDVVVDLLRDKPWEHRVTAYLNPMRAGPLAQSKEFIFFHKEWLENQFPYYRIQTLDIDQMPRMPELDRAFLEAFTPSPGGSLSIVTRLWELTGTRYVLGPADPAGLAQALDPGKQRFSVRIPFTLGLRRGASQPDPKTPINEVMMEVMAVQNPKGPFALLEFSGALPRAKLFTRWEISTNSAATLARLKAPEFDPTAVVVLSDTPEALSPKEGAAGTATIAEYQPKRVVVKTQSESDSVLLLNDRWHEHWSVTVDGQPAALLQANFIMRGVPLKAGEHTVEFTFNPPHKLLYVTLVAELACLLAAGVLCWDGRRAMASPPE